MISRLRAGAQSWRDSLGARFAGIPVVFFGVGLAFAIARVDADIRAIATGTFAVLAGLASASFSLARSIANDELQDRFVHIGERLLHAALYLLLAAAFAFSFSWLAEYLPQAGKHGITLLVRAVILIGLVVAAMGATAEGVSGLHWILWHRRSRYRYWDNSVPPVLPKGDKEPLDPVAVPPQSSGEPPNESAASDVRPAMVSRPVA